jgi:hypothetical protein
MEIAMSNKSRFQTNAILNLRINWLELRRQKMDLLARIDYLQNSTDDSDMKAAQSFEALVSMINGIQDQAAEQLGADIVFGDVLKENLVASVCDPCSTSVGEGEGCGWIDLDGITHRFCDEECMETYRDKWLLEHT